MKRVLGGAAMKRILGGAAMKRILVWCTALTPLLASSLALALTTSAPQEVPPPGTTTPPDPIACDYGPNYNGSIPAGASAAGFTRCAVNLDFTNSRFASLSNWIDCFGATGPASTPILNQIDGVAGNKVPCDSNHYAMVSDGPYSQVFKATWLSSDGNHNNNLYSTYSRGSTVFPAYAGFTLPNGQFIEWTWRSTIPSCPSHGCLVWAPFEYPPAGDPNQFLEYDFGELYEGTNGNGTGCLVQSNANSFIYMPTCDPGNYHTYGYRITTDGNSNIAMCNYFSSTPVNGLSAATFNNCLTTFKSGIQSSREGMYPMWGPFGADVAAGFFGSTPSFSIYLVRLTVWECPGWEGPNEHSNVFAGAQCNGTLLTSGP
jgi:hypothetical protein